MYIHMYIHICIYTRPQTVSGTRRHRRNLKWSSPNHPVGDFYLTESVHKVVLQKSTPAEIRQLVFMLVTIKVKSPDLCGN